MWGRFHGQVTHVFLFVWVYFQGFLNSCDIPLHILQGCFTDTGAIMWLPQCLWHYTDATMDTIASQITSLMIVYSTVHSRRTSKIISKLCVTGLCAGNSPEIGEFPAQMACNAENVSIWWRHHEATLKNMGKTYQNQTTKKQKWAS